MHDKNLRQYKGFHIQSKSLGLDYIETLTEKEKLDLVKDGIFTPAKPKIARSLFITRKKFYLLLIILLIKLRVQKLPFRSHNLSLKRNFSDSINVLGIELYRSV